LSSAAVAHLFAIKTLFVTKKLPAKQQSSKAAKQQSYIE
jgi:hypothetical protein